ncbi:protein insensitive-like [Musca vetustissima]|uniref:protein insensitive-like n=1 Tax=Musca vetustissima TaxID=27455 RepID=UPI002AB76AB5|nr:protein insensitive-like [Musca vetustissima]
MVFEQFVADFPLHNPSYSRSYVDMLTTELRLKRLNKRQMDSAIMFDRLKVIIDQMEEAYCPSSCNQVKDPAFIADHNYAYSNSSSGITTSTSSSSTSPPPFAEQRFNGCSSNEPSAKRKIIDDDYEEFSAEDDTNSPKNYHMDMDAAQYPQQMGDMVILGPNGTTVDARSYSSIIWASSASATRQLLSFVFSSDILATHTLTGKPSPAFYGRERPAKMQLDPIKAADIIHCVKSKFNCSEREIRAAITTKCSDTSKKYKRRSQKLQMDSVA